MADSRFDPEFVEFVVREVMRRLASGHAVQPSAGTPTGNRELNITERLITMATVRDRLDGVTAVSISRRAIVTPAVRDELNQRQIQVKRG